MAAARACRACRTVRPSSASASSEAVLRLGGRCAPRYAARLATISPAPACPSAPAFARSGFSPVCRRRGSVRCSVVHEVCQGSCAAAPGLAGLVAGHGHTASVDDAPHARVCWLMERHAARSSSTPTGGCMPRTVRRCASGETARSMPGRASSVPTRLIEQPELIDVRAVWSSAHDPQIRRCMIDIMTPKRFVEQGGAYRVVEDETGILWRQRWRWEAWAAVEVINGTPEPDGTYKRYFLQVPPTVRTNRTSLRKSRRVTADPVRLRAHPLSGSSGRDPESVARLRSGTSTPRPRARASSSARMAMSSPTTT